MNHTVGTSDPLRSQAIRFRDLQRLLIQACQLHLTHDTSVQLQKWVALMSIVNAYAVMALYLNSDQRCRFGRIGTLKLQNIESQP
jgi:hypothetical protein